MIRKLDGLIETVDYESSTAYILHHNTENEDYPKHWHSAVEVIMPVKNPYNIIMTDEVYHLNEFDIIIIPSGDLHELATCTDLGERLILQFDLSIFKTMEGLINFSYIFLKPCLITTETNPDLHASLKEILLDIFTENRLKNNYFEASTVTKIINFAIEIARKQNIEISHDNEFLFKRKEHLATFNKCIDYIGQHYKDDLSLDFIAKIAGFSKYHFLRWFKQYSKMTFNDYLLQIRIKAAESMLNDLNIPITDVALESGFQSITTFNRVFKNMKKCTPTEYRNLKRNAKAMNTNMKKTVVKNKPAPYSADTESYVALPGVPLYKDKALKVANKDGRLLVDIPSPDVIYAEGAYYMISTSMYFFPSCPIMKSYDLINWETASYVFDVLTDIDAMTFRNDKNSYGEGTRVCCLRYHRGIYYAAFVSYTTRKTYIFKTDNIETGTWKKSVLDGAYHDLSLVFDGDRKFIVYGSGAINLCELNTDASEVMKNGISLNIIANANMGSDIYRHNAENSHAYKLGRYYYIFLTNETDDGRPIQLCYRSSKIDGDYEGKIILDADIAGGSIVETPDGEWYAALYQNQGSLGRTPVFVQMSFADNWPVLNPNNTLKLRENDRISSYLISSDEFYNNQSSINMYKNTKLSEYCISKSGYLNDVKRSSVEIIENGNFRNGMNSWVSYNYANISIKSNELDDGQYLLYVSSRKSTNSGPMQLITGKVGKGEKFKISALVKYNNGPKQHIFNIAICNGTDYQNIQVTANGMVTRGEWCLVEGIYTIPMNADTSYNAIFVETLWNDNPSKETDLMNFYVKNVSMIKKHSFKTSQSLEGEYDFNGSILSPYWQWNHNPDNNFWSLTDRVGYLRLYNGSTCSSLTDARNTLTMRTFGPKCSCSTALDVSGMHGGDIAGLAAFNMNYAYIGVKVSGSKKYIIMTNSTNDESKPLFMLELNQDRVYFKADFDFESDNVSFYFSLDELVWYPASDEYKMTKTHSTSLGYRAALFSFGKESVGGYADYDYFRIDNRLLKEITPPQLLKTEFVTVTEIMGVPDKSFKLGIKLESLKDKSCKGIYISMKVPPELEVADVYFNKENITGGANYEVTDNRLLLTAGGNGVCSYINKSSDLFAEVKFKVREYISNGGVFNFKPDYIYADGAEVIYITNKAECEVKIKPSEVNGIAKKLGFKNPLIDHKYGADPAVLVYNDRVYVYLTNDTLQYGDKGEPINNIYSNINTITVISSNDLVNWTDHGAIPVAGEAGLAAWAKNSWAPAICYKNINGVDKFFLYFANNGSNIGVITALSPLGPWRDPIGKPIVHKEMPNCENVIWCFDPAVLTDDDNAYLYFGGGLPSLETDDVLHPRTARVIKLGSDMISTEGDAVTLDAPAFFEDSDIFKLGNKYYYSYCSNFSEPHPEGYPPEGEIAYMIGSDPMGPFRYIGPVLKNPQHYFGIGGNNHHSFFNFKDKWYIAYHAGTLDKEVGQIKGYRSPHINEVEFYSNGGIKEIKADMTGVKAVGTINPYYRVEAETFAWCSGVDTAALSSNDGYNNLVVKNIHNGDWMGVANVDFGAKGATLFSANISSYDGGVIELHLDNLEGEIIGILRVNPYVERWNIRSCAIKRLTNVHDIYFIFKGDNGGILFNLDYWIFSN